MADSVAGQIRIDLIANAARFNAGMKEAGRDGLGGFATNFKQKSAEIKQLIEKERSAWVAAMRGDNFSGPMGKTANPLGDLFSGGPGVDQALRSQTRWKSMLPWGNTMRTEMSREAAETAATISKEGAKLQSLFGQSMRASTMSLLGGGGLSGERLATMTGGMSAATVGIGMFAAGIMGAQRSAAALGEEIKRVREEANRLGMTYDKYVSQQGLPKYSMATEGGALGAAQGWDELKGFGAGVFGGAMSLFGGDPESLAQGEREKERRRLRSNRENKSTDLIMGMQRSVAYFGKTAEQVARAEWIAKLSPTQDQIEMWDSLNAQLDKLKAKQEASRITKDQFSAWNEARRPGSKAEDEYRDLLRRQGKSPDEQEADLQFFRQRKKETESLNRANTMADATRSPEDRLNQATADADLWRQEHAGRMEDEETYWKMRRRAAEDYYREVAGLDAKQLEESAKTAADKYRERLAYINEMQGANVISGAAGDAARRDARDSIRASVGVRDRKEEYARKYKELTEAYNAGAITGEEGKKRRDELRREYAESEMAGQPKIDPIAASTAGSAAAHTLAVRAAIADPKTKIAADSLATLQRIENKIKAGEPVGATLGS